MKKKNIPYAILASNIAISFIIKLVLFFRYSNTLNLASDDLNYIKSAVTLIKRGIFVYHNYNEPTVFVTPLYPFFLAGVFKIFGFDTAGMQAVRIFQALFSSITILLIFMIAKKLFNLRIAVISSFLVSYYPPNITTSGYMLTETVFTTLLCLLIYLSIKYSAEDFSKAKYALLGIVWAAATLCRPTVALYPFLFFAYLVLYRKINFIKLLKTGLVITCSFILAMSPWWIRNYVEYDSFIALAASSGNPMLQGTYINYIQTPENTIYYKLGKNYLETNKAEIEAAKARISFELKKDFFRYVRWYTVDKTLLLWAGPFYWKGFFNLYYNDVLKFHIVILLGFAGIFILAFESVFNALYSKKHRRKPIADSNNMEKIHKLKVEPFSKYVLPVLVILYFNLVHCMYMTFDRYAFPLLPLLSIYSAFFLNSAATLLIAGSSSLAARLKQAF